MAKEQSELAALQESVHSLAEALQLLRNIFQAQETMLSRSPHFRKFEVLVRDLLSKTAPTD